MSANAKNENSISLITANSGLRLHKLLDIIGNGTLQLDKGGLQIPESAREALLDGIVQRRATEQYEKYYLERQKWLGKNTDRSIVITAVTKSRLVTGLSYGISQLSGCTLHHTYGVPMLTGSQVKGACRDAALLLREEKHASGAEGSDEKIFELYGDQTTGVGAVCFLDALPDPSMSKHFFEKDILTPHHSDYYSGKPGYGDAPDTEDPTPVLFLTVPVGIAFQFSFLFPDKEAREQYGPYIIKHLKQSNETGFGAKVSSGYGWFEFGSEQQVSEEL